MYDTVLSEDFSYPSRGSEMWQAQKYSGATACILARRTDACLG